MVVLTNSSLEEQIRVNKITHENGNINQFKESFLYKFFPIRTLDKLSFVNARGVFFFEKAPPF